MTTKDDDEEQVLVGVFDTYDEAVAAVMATSEPGTEVTIHAQTCATGREEPCDCEPIELVVSGNKA
jgi:hypothetical protein